MITYSFKLEKQISLYPEITAAAISNTGLGNEKRKYVNKINK
jgi:hypothetical protein